MLYSTMFLVMIVMRCFANGHPKLMLQLYYLLLVFLFLFVAFRFEVGCDWLGYLSQFYVQLRADLSFALARNEALWWVILYVIQSMDLPYPWINVVSSAIFFVGVHSLAKRQPDALGFLILLFPILIINMPMSGIRQGAAIGLVCIAFGAFTDKRLFKFIFFVFTASFIHSSASIFLLLAPLVRGEYSKKRLMLAALLAVPGLILLIGGDSGQQAVSRYVNTGRDAAGGIFRIGLLFITGAFYFLVARKKWFTAYRHDFKLVTIGAVMILITACVLPISSLIGDRIGYYLIPLQTVIFARLPFLALGRYRPFYAVMPYLGLFLVFLTWTLLSHHFQQCYLPYQTWIFGFPGGNPF